MIQLFKIGSVDRLLLLLGLFACMHLPYLLFNEQVLVQEILRLRLGERLADGWNLYAQAADDTAPLSSLLYGLMARFGLSDFWLLRVTGALLLWIQAIWFNRMAIRYQLVSERNYLIAFFYLIVAHCAADTVSLSPGLIALTFLLFSLNKLFAILRDGANAEEAMLAGLYLGLAIIAQQAFAIFLISFFLTCLFFSGLKVNHYFLMVAAALFPSFAFYAWFTLTGGLSDFSYCFAAGFRIFPALVLCDLQAIFYPGGLLLFCTLAGWIFSNQQSRVNVQRMGFTVFFFLAVAGTAGIFMGSVRSTENLLLLLLPASFFLAQICLLNKSVLFNEIWGIGLSILIIGNFYFQPEIPLFGWSKNLFAGEPPKGFSANFPEKKLLLLSNDYRFYRYNQAAGPHLRFYMGRLQAKPVDTYESLIYWYQCLAEDPPEIIYDPNKLIPQIAGHIPEFNRCYKASFYPDLYVQRAGKNSENEFGYYFCAIIFALPRQFTFQNLMKNNPGQSTSTILMVRPEDFTFNTETAMDNEFQQQLAGTDARQEALLEFQQATEILMKEGVKVLILEKDQRLASMPDAVFPNNWFASDGDGFLHVFPMKAANRKAETSQLSGVLHLLENAGFHYHGIQDWRQKLSEDEILEGTGSLILDRQHKRFFASISERTQESACRKFAAEAGYEAILFHTQSSAGFAYYHTNVVMSLGPKLAVACLECIPDAAERQMVKEEIRKHHNLIEISISQLEKGFCGNLLQVLNKNGEILTILSQTAFDALSEIQRQEIAKSGRLVPIPIPVIEKVGGGSIRCMMAEIFCPEREV